MAYWRDITKVPLPRINIRVRQLTPSDHDEIQSLADFHFYGQTKADILQYLAAGQRCYFAEQEGRVISCFWTLSGRFYDGALRRYIDLTGNEEYLLGAYTLADFRGKNVLPYLVSESARIHGSIGSRAVAFVDVHNRAVIASSRKLGFSVVGQIGFVEFFGLKLHYLLGRDALPKTSPRFFLSIASG